VLPNIMFAILIVFTAHGPSICQSAVASPQPRQGRDWRLLTRLDSLHYGQARTGT
jgi:hypothetical protein